MCTCESSECTSGLHQLLQRWVLNASTLYLKLQVSLVGSQQNASMETSRQVKWIGELWERADKVNRRFRAFSRGLDHELRHRVLSQRFTESQRQELERWMPRPQFHSFPANVLGKAFTTWKITCNDAKHATFALNAASRHHTTSIPARIFRARQRKKAPVSNSTTTEVNVLRQQYPQCTTDIYKIRQHENIDVCRKFTFFSICSVKKTSVLTYFCLFFLFVALVWMCWNHSMRFQGFKSEWLPKVSCSKLEQSHKALLSSFFVAFLLDKTLLHFPRFFLCRLDSGQAECNRWTTLMKFLRMSPVWWCIHYAHS